MSRTLSYAATAAALAATAFVPAAFAEGETVNVNVRVDVASMIDTKAAEKTLRDVERQARKACRYVQPATQRKLTDWTCAKAIIEQTLSQLDAPVLTAAHATSDRMVLIAQRAERENASQS